MLDSTGDGLITVCLRGVGLAATNQACEAAGGSAMLTTKLGHGSKLTFRFRAPVVWTSALAAAIERRWSLPLASITYSGAAA